MTEFFIILAGFVIVGLFAVVQVRHFPPNAQLLCDIWDFVESEDK